MKKDIHSTWMIKILLFYNTTIKKIKMVDENQEIHTTDR